MTNTVFDASNRADHTKSLAFLDPNGGVAIQRFETMKYRQFDKLTDRQLSFFWRPEEIAIDKDGKDFKLLSDHEKHIFTANLKRQILLDSVQGRSPNLAFLPIVSLPELEAWIATWAFSETIHSRSYTHIIRNIYADPSVIFDKMMDIQEIVDCAKDISQYYDRLIELSSWYQLLGEGTHVVNGHEVVVDRYEIKKALWMALMSVNILEGVRFYVSFACSFAFGELKKLEGNAKIIKFICLSDDTEILTPRGWTLFKELVHGVDKVAQYNMDGTIEFVLPSAYIEQEHAPGEAMVRLSNRRGQFDMLVTDSHRVVYRDVASNALHLQSAGKFNPSCVKAYPVAGRIRGGTNTGLTALERFRIAVQADGHMEARMTGAHSGLKSVVFNLRKRRKIDRLYALLGELGFEHTNPRGAEGETVTRVRYPADIEFGKDFSWFSLEDLTVERAQEFLNEVAQWDGHHRSADQFVYCNTNMAAIEKVQQVAVLSGSRSNLSSSVDNRKESYKDYHRLTITRGRDTYNCGTKPNTKSIVTDYDGKVYCVTVPSSMIVVRRKGQPFVTGNCRDENLHLAFTQSILKVLPQDDADFGRIAQESRDDCVALFRAAAEQEKAWADYLFKDGSMIGLNVKLLHDYVEWITNKRMTAVGLPAQFKAGANPLPWTQKWIAGSEVQIAPQETEVQQYQIGETKQDVDDNTFKGFSL